jgi:hypothetical protein
MSPDDSGHPYETDLERHVVAACLRFPVPDPANM